MSVQLTRLQFVGSLIEDPLKRTEYQLFLINFLQPFVVGIIT